MAFEIIKPSKAFLHPQSFFKKISAITPDEKNYCSQLIRQALKDRVRIHILINSETLEIIGLLALSVGMMGQSAQTPCIVINYLLTALPYRGQVLQELGNRRVSEYMVDYSLKTAAQINSHIPLRYVALSPVHEKLIPLYASLDFFTLDNSGLMFFKLEQ